MSLKEKAMLVSLSLSTWSGRKYDRVATQEVIEKHSAPPDAGRFNKLLVSKTYLDPITTAVSALRTGHYDRTLPWADDGWRLLPATGFFAYTEMVRKGREKLNESTASLFASWDVIIEDRKSHLNGLFDPRDYPALDMLRSKYAVSINYMPVPEGGDIRVDLDPSDVEAIRRQVDISVGDRLKDAHLSLWQRVYDVVDHFAAVMSEPGKRFHASTIANIRSVCEIVPKLNLSQDKQLDKIVSDISQTLAKYEPDDLRVTKDNPDAGTTRGMAAEEAKAMCDEIRKHMDATR